MVVEKRRLEHLPVVVTRVVAQHPSIVTRRPVELLEPQRQKVRVAETVVKPVRAQVRRVMPVERQPNGATLHEEHKKKPMLNKQLPVLQQLVYPQRLQTIPKFLKHKYPCKRRKCEQTSVCEHPVATRKATRTGSTSAC